jgi:hypothetical protein
MFSPYPAAILAVVKPQRGRGCRDVVVDSAARLRRAGIARGERFIDPAGVSMSSQPLREPGPDSAYPRFLQGFWFRN